MRKLKLRARNFYNGEWSYGSGIVICDDCCFLDKNDECYIQGPYEFRGNTHFIELASILCDKEPICLFTGLYDKNGSEIYEGDIIRSFDDKNNEILHYIEWKNSTARYVAVHISSNNLSLQLCSDISQEWIDEFDKEIIGNIYHNPELLKK